MAGAEAECESVGTAYGCASAKATAKAAARAWASAVAVASADAVVKCGKCKVAAKATAAGKATLHVKLAAFAFAAAEASVCVKGPVLRSRTAALTPLLVNADLNVGGHCSWLSYRDWHASGKCTQIVQVKLLSSTWGSMVVQEMHMLRQRPTQTALPEQSSRSMPWCAFFGAMRVACSTAINLCLKGGHIKGGHMPLLAECVPSVPSAAARGQCSYEDGH
jgi:hypothetical protein